MTQSTAISLKGRPTGAASGGSAGVSGDDRRSVAVSAAGAIAFALSILLVVPGAQCIYVFSE